ncbi:MAG: hypothetical protein AB9917_21420 [Negativicutes bacterium]
MTAPIQHDFRQSDHVFIRQRYLLYHQKKYMQEFAVAYSGVSPPATIPMSDKSDLAYHSIGIFIP